jgi:hypothetical protein
MPPAPGARDEDGNPGRERENLRDALRPLKRLYSQTAAADFGPLTLRALQDELIRAGLSRNVINYRVNRIRRVFKWAVSFDLVPAAIHQALQTAPGLRRGRSKAREAEKVKPCTGPGRGSGRSVSFKESRPKESLISYAFMVIPPTGVRLATRSLEPPEPPWWSTLGVGFPRRSCQIAN